MDLRAEAIMATLQKGLPYRGSAFQDSVSGDEIILYKFKREKKSLSLDIHIHIIPIV